MKVNLKRAAISGIIGEIAYFISMMLFLITHTNFALTLWESMTVIGSIVMLIAFLVIADEFKINMDECSWLQDNFHDPPRKGN